MNNPMSLTLIYGEHREADGTVSKGVFVGLCAYMAYRERGWSSTAEIDALADQGLVDAKNLQYLAR